MEGEYAFLMRRIISEGGSFKAPAIISAPSDSRVLFPYYSRDLAGSVAATGYVVLLLFPKIAVD